ncbi:glutathionylspermidine synthase family protein [Paenibacillus agricola]|uniref:Glutathionylspermidine synthase family protein n=1 Tax=Paenibacillus agricola TaxID=2716264 RepID=A0ABX0JHT4_9BACL|nr:glutathionylspermidine synthase family protein [Paenibacillus agricola]NHN33416.1 glutathionylspermidine synthase family protein [Paenibacillus agricola]
MVLLKADRQELGYAARREQIYGPLKAEGVFTWDMMYGDEYALAGIQWLDRSLHRRMQEAAEGLKRVYARTVQIVQQADDALLGELGLAPSTYAAVRLSMDTLLPTMIGRFDFAVNGSDIKMLEFNSDTPTGIVEAFHVNGHVCAVYGAKDPNEGCTASLQQAFAETVEAYRAAGFRTEHMYFSALDWHEEDAGTTRYLLGQSKLPGRFVPLSELRVDGDRLWVIDEATQQLSPVDLLYRLHAIEKLAEEQDEDGYPTGEHMLQLITQGQLAIINPPSGFLAQTKALQALIWNLHEQNQFYSAEEHAIIEAYMLPTYLENRFSKSQGTDVRNEAYVVKPIFGREGSGVAIYGPDGSLWEQSGEDEYANQPMIYQTYIELPQITVETLKGPVTGRLLWGCFLIGGQASAVVARVGGLITSNLSYYLPVGFDETKEVEEQ